MGPCWLAHKRLESWSRMAKERVNAVRRDRTEDTSTSMSTSTSDSQSNSMCDSTDLNLSMEVNYNDEEGAKAQHSPAVQTLGVMVAYIPGTALILPHRHFPIRRTAM